MPDRVNNSGNAFSLTEWTIAQKGCVTSRRKPRSANPQHAIGVSLSARYVPVFLVFVKVIDKKWRFTRME